MTFLERIRVWWNKDAVEREEEEELAGMSRGSAMRARKTSRGARTKSPFAAGLGGAADYESDSEPPRP